MTRFTFSMRARLTSSIVVFVVIIFGVSLNSVLSLRSAGLKSQEIDRQWLAGAGVLLRLDARLAQFRNSEEKRLLTSIPELRARADLLADGRPREIEHLLDEYVASVRGLPARVELNALRGSWNAYHQEHDAWVNSTIGGVSGNPEGYDGSLRRHYQETDAAVDRLIAVDVAAARAGAAAINELTGRSIAVTVVICAAAILLATWLVQRIGSQFIRPLTSITRALAKLAAGSRDVRVPELHRADELGALANAFEIFRTNALALERSQEATRLAQDEAHSLVRHDSLTGLPNRRGFTAELQAVLSRVHTGIGSFCVLLIGLDRFKQINDLQGRSIGDLVLCEVARRLVEVVQERGTVARLGGDEFAIIARNNSQPQAQDGWASHLANRVLVAIRKPITVGAGTVEISASVGIAPWRIDRTEAGSLLHAADVAMYRAKRDGKGTYRVFEQGMDDDLRAQGAIEADLKAAVAGGKILPCYQPMVELRTNRICGFEALARWEHPGRGSVSPDLFIPLIEQLGLMTPFTTSILRQACRDAKHWADDIRLSVNLSPSELKDALLPARLLALLAQEGFPPERLDVEITETALVTDIGTAQLILTSLRESGIKVCLDDFGTGYSSLFHLRELKFDRIKIDRSFVQSMRNNPESEKIVDAILGLTKNLNLTTVAEGIEDPEVVLRLAAKGCEFGQGYYFGKAMSAESVKLVLAARTTAAK